MSGYNGFPGPDSKIQMAVVDSREEAKDKSCNQKCYSPTNHGQDVDFDHLMQNPMIQGASGFLQQIYGGTVDPGTPVLMLKSLGDPGGVILGQSNTVRKGGQGADGGGAPGMGKVSELTSHEIDVNTPPDIKETEEGGVMIRKIIEKGISHKLDLLDGLPLHGALFDMAGFRLPDVKNVPTAKQTNDQMMNAQMLQQMAGQIMSLGQMFQGLMGNKGAGGGGGGYGAGSSGLGINLPPGESYVPPGANTGAGGAEYGGGLGNNSISAFQAPEGTPMYQIMEGLTPQMQAAVNSLSILIQGLETNDGVAFFTGDVVHEETYLKNAQQLLSQVDSLDDLMYVLNRLQWDTSLFGREQLSNVVNEIETAWGVALQEVDYNGNVIVTYGLEDANSEIEFLDSMTSNTSSPALGYFGGEDPTYSVNATGASLGFNAGIGGGGQGGQGGAQQAIEQVQGLLGQIQGLAQGMDQNMFGESAETMKEMWKRMTREQENDAKKMHQKLNQSGDTQKMSQIVEKTVKGGKVFEKQYYDENALESSGESVGSGGFSVGFL